MTDSLLSVCNRAVFSVPTRLGALCCLMRMVRNFFRRASNVNDVAGRTHLLSALAREMLDFSAPLYVSQPKLTFPSGLISHQRGLSLGMTFALVRFAPITEIPSATASNIGTKCGSPSQISGLAGARSDRDMKRLARLAASSYLLAWDCTQYTILTVQGKRRASEGKYRKAFLCRGPLRWADCKLSNTTTSGLYLSIQSCSLAFMPSYGPCAAVFETRLAIRSFPANNAIPRPVERTEIASVFFLDGIACVRS